MKFKLLILSSFLALASCKQAAQTVVVVGDSWASYVCYYKSLDNALKSAGITDALSNSTCMATTRTGIHAEEWLGSTFDKTTQAALLDPSVKVMYLSIGGNDVISSWNKSMTAAQEKELFDKVAANIEAIVKKYQAIRPEMKILISGYDFPRFFLNHPIKAYADAYDDMGHPTPIELNSAVLRFSERISHVADQKTVFYIQHYGMMQYYFGNTETGLAPKSTLSPDQISTPQNVNQTGGDTSMQSDKQAMFTIGTGNFIVYDAFHLNHFGFDRIGDHAVMMYLKDWLKH